MDFIMDIKELESALEGILFAAGEPVGMEQLSKALDVEEETIEKVLDELADYYSFNRRGIRIVRLEDSYQMTTATEFADWIRAALELRKVPQMSRAAMEVLSIIAYYQPVTRAYIEQIRGVDSSATVGLLNERGLIEDCGYLDVPGRPRLFRTTRAFLRTFGISSVDELPQIDMGDEALLEGQMKIEESIPEEEIPAEYIEAEAVPDDGDIAGNTIEFPISGYNEE